MVTKQKPLTKGGFSLFIVKFEIESNFENRLNLRGLKMKYISIPVYRYSELSEQAQFSARIEWEDTNPTEYLIDSFKEFIKELEYVGIILHSWEFDYCEFDFKFYIYSDLGEFEMEGLSAFKKILGLYYKLNLVPKIYKSKTKRRISKIQEVPDEKHDWIYYSFVESLKEILQKKNLKCSLEDYLKEALDRTLEEIQKEYVAILESLPTVAEDYDYYFYANGSRCYEAEKV